MSEHTATVNGTASDSGNENRETPLPRTNEATLRELRDVASTYRRILDSDAMKRVFQIAQIHGTRYTGEQVDPDEVDRIIGDADRILGPAGTPPNRGGGSGAEARTPGTGTRS